MSKLIARESKFHLLFVPLEQTQLTARSFLSFTAPPFAVFPQAPSPAIFHATMKVKESKISTTRMGSSLSTQQRGSRSVVTPVLAKRVSTVAGSALHKKGTINKRFTSQKLITPTHSKEVSVKPRQISSISPCRILPQKSKVLHNHFPDKSPRGTIVQGSNRKRGAGETDFEVAAQALYSGRIAYWNDLMFGLDMQLDMELEEQTPKEDPPMANLATQGSNLDKSVPDDSSWCLAHNAELSNEETAMEIKFPLVKGKISKVLLEGSSQRHSKRLANKLLREGHFVAL